MPEGDTIHRTAAALRRALLDRRLTRVELPRIPLPHPALGATITRIEARGKHLLIHASDGLVVHTHQRMTGAWHLYRPRERWRKSPRAARVVLGVDGEGGADDGTGGGGGAGVVAVCFAAPVVAVLGVEDLARHPTLRRLGPDLCDPQVDLDTAAQRLGRFSAPDRTIGEALLDQRIACGVGNVYRSDVLFLHGLAPDTPVAGVPEEQRRALLATASDLLRANLEGSDRTTVVGGAGGSLWVYGRAGEPCRRCGTPIVRSVLGEQARSVYHCPACQRRPVPA